MISIQVFAEPQLIVEPDNGRSPILTAINNAKQSIQLVIYGITDPDIIHALIRAKNQHKNVEILYEPSPYKNANENTYAIRQFQQAGLRIKSANSAFQLTHQKTFIFDHRYALIMTFNLTRSTFDKERNFALLIDDPVLIQEIEKVFHADWQQNNSTVTNEQLVWSPDNSREKILALINSAQHDINIYAQNITDYRTIGALAHAARSGLQVKVLLSAEAEHQHSNKLSYLKKAGVIIKFHRALMIHAKVIIVDNERAYLGSINFTKPSMDNNRELGIITDDAKVVTQLKSVFNQDWETFHLSQRHIKYLQKRLLKLLTEL